MPCATEFEIYIFLRNCRGALCAEPDGALQESGEFGSQGLMGLEFKV